MGASVRAQFFLSPSYLEPVYKLDLLTFPVALEAKIVYGTKF